MDTHSVAFPEPQVPAHSRLPLTPRVPTEKSRIAKVCAECGEEFVNTLSYTMHVTTHQLWLECNKCPFKTKSSQKLQWHGVYHLRNPEQKCIACDRSYNRINNLLVHQRKAHDIHQCKYCGSVWKDVDDLRRHMQEIDSKDGPLPSCWLQKNKDKTIPQTAKTHNSQSASSFYQATGRRPRKSKVQMVQHVEEPDKEVTSEALAEIPEVLVKQERDSYDDSNPAPALSDLRPVFPATMEAREVPRQPVQVANTLNPTLPTLTSTPFSPDGSLVTYNSVPQPFQLIRPHFILDPSLPSTTNEGNLVTPSTSPKCVPSMETIVPSPGITFKLLVRSVPSATSGPNNTPVPHDSHLSDIRPSTSFEGRKQTVGLTDTFIQEQEMEEKKGDILYCCKLCPCGFLSSTDFQKHFQRSHPDEPFLKYDKHNWLNPLKKQKAKGKSKARKVKLNFPCVGCKEVFRSSKALIKHKKLKHKRALVCSECNAILRSNYRLGRHQKAVHKDKFRCRYYCVDLFNTREELDSHYRRVHKSYKKEECPYCLKLFYYKGCLTNHLKKCGKRPVVKKAAHVCGICEELFPNIVAYKKHAANCLPTLTKRNKREAASTSSRDKRIKIQKSGYKDGATQPEEDSTEEPENTDQGKSGDSNESDDSDTDAGEASSGMPTSSTSKKELLSFVPKKCKYCPDSCMKETNVIGHIVHAHSDMVNHMIEAPLMCKVCGQIFKYASSLCKHIMKHYYKLNRWDGFVPKDILNIVKVKGYCWICNTHQDFRKGSHSPLRDKDIDEALEVEEILNKEMIPLRCDKCAELFPTRKEFWHHVKVHLAELPAGTVHYGGSEDGGKLFECRKCQFSYSSRDELYQHIADHFLVKDEKITSVTEESKAGDAEACEKGDAEASSRERSGKQ